MNLIKPKKLHPGDTIAIIAPGGCIDIEKVSSVKKYFESKGYRVKLGDNIKKQNRYLAGNDKERVEDLHNAFLDTDINAIICARGGYGAIRLLDKIDYEIIRANPKIFCGFSDITALSAMFLKRAGLITFSAPMAQSDFYPAPDNYTLTSFFNALTKDTIQISSNNEILYNQMDVSGILLGGNLSTMASLCGVDFIPDEKFLFFAEDLNEPAYKIDRYFTQLLNINKIKSNVCAILLGDFLDVDKPDYVSAFFKELSQEINIPVIGKFAFSHARQKATVPVGASAAIQNNIITVKNFTV